MRKSSLIVSLATGCCLIAITAGAQSYRNIYKLGNPDTRFSATEANSLEELQRQFVTHRGDLEEVLRLGGWTGSSDELFRTVAEARPGGPAVTARAMPQGETFAWMAYRRDGKPTVQRNVRWAAAEPFPAWQIQFVSGDRVHTFVVPHVCLNLAYDGRPLAVTDPAAPQVPGVPGAPAAPAAAPSDAAPAAPAPAVPPSAPPAAPAPESETAAPPAAPSPPAAPTPTPAPAPISESETMPPMERESRWIVRGWGANVDVKQDTFTTIGSETRFLPEPAIVGLRSDFQLGSGSGVGFDVEYMFSRRLGVDFGAFFGDLDSMFKFDTDFPDDALDIWVMDNADVGINIFFVGVNYHLTPDKRADLFVGPFLSRIQYDDTTFTTSEATFRSDFDGETTVGAVLGLDFPFSRDGHWGLTAAVRYMAASAEAANGSFDLDVDPTLFSIGIGYRF